MIRPILSSSSRTTSTILAKPARQAISASARRYAPASARRYASHGPTYNQPSGHLFGEKPLAKGQKRVKEDWENIYYVGMFGGMAFAALVLVYKPDTSIQAWALQEAKSRMVESGEWAKIEYKGGAKGAEE